MAVFTDARKHNNKEELNAHHGNKWVIDCNVYKGMRKIGTATAKAISPTKQEAKKFGEQMIMNDYGDKITKAKAVRVKKVNQFN